MTQTVSTDAELDALFLDATPLLDVRAPVEFGAGAFPTATNIALLNDDERHQVGVCYKRDGQDAAIALGNQLVAGDVRTARLARWCAFVTENPDSALYCFRGGLRSQTVQRWLADEGVDVRLIKGGYKRMRKHLMAATERLCNENDVFILGGRTGVGKTRIIHAVAAAADLEGRANHRGSAFGRWPTPQPSQIDFENAIAIDLMRIAQLGHSAFVFEDESNNVGHLSVPLPVVAQIDTAPLVLLEASVEERVDETVRGYITETLAVYQAANNGTQGFDDFAEALSASLARIQRRLGAERYKELATVMQKALDKHRDDGDANAHRDWIRVLLTEYYDPMYDYQIGLKQDRICFRGDMVETTQWLAHQTRVAT